MPRKPPKNKKLAERAAPIREVLQQLVKKRVKTKDQREALAKFLNQEVQSVSNMIYSGDGGLDSWIGALAFCYNLDPKGVEKSLEDFEKYIRKAGSVSETDKLYFALSEKLDKDDLHFLLSLINNSVRIGSKN